MQQRMIIDGQQRLTTLQLLLDALHAELVRVGAKQPAARIESLVTNDAPFKASPRTASRCGRPIATGRPSTRSWAPLHPSTTPLLASRTSAWLKPTSFSANRHESGFRQAALMRSHPGRHRRDRCPGPAADGGHRPRPRRERAGDFRDPERPRRHLTAADLIKNFVFQRLQEGHQRGDRVRE